jgi:hypothetical protein
MDIKVILNKLLVSLEYESLRKYFSCSLKHNIYIYRSCMHVYLHDIQHVNFKVLILMEVGNIATYIWYITI